MMKLKLLLLLGFMLFPMCMFSQVKTTNAEELESVVFTINSSGIVLTNKTMIDPFDLTGFDINNLSYTLTNPVSFRVGNSTFTVKTSIFKDWEENEKIGFNVIGLYKGEIKILEVKQLENWTFTYGGKSSLDYRKYTTNRYFIPLKLSNSTTALIFVGWPYGGDLPYLTIIAVTEREAKLVFNKHMRLNSIIQSENQCVMNVKTESEEYDASGKLAVAPKLAGIYLKNGVLYLKR